MNIKFIKRRQTITSSFSFSKGFSHCRSLSLSLSVFVCSFVCLWRGTRCFFFIRKPYQLRIRCVCLSSCTFIFNLWSTPYSVNRIIHRLCITHHVLAYLYNNRRDVNALLSWFMLMLAQNSFNSQMFELKLQLTESDAWYSILWTIPSKVTSASAKYKHWFHFTVITSQLKFSVIILALVDRKFITHLVWNGRCGKRNKSIWICSCSVLFLLSILFCVFCLPMLEKTRIAHGICIFIRVLPAL